MKYILIGIILVAALAYLIDTFIRWLHYRKEKRKQINKHYSRIQELLREGEPRLVPDTYASNFNKSLLEASEKPILNMLAAAESQKELQRRRPSINDDTLDAMRYAALWAQELQAQSSSMDYYLGAEAAPSPGFEGFGGGDFSGGGASGDWGSNDTGSADAGGSFGND